MKASFKPFKFWIFEKKNKWKYTLDKDITVFDINYNSITFDNDFLNVNYGYITVKKKYSWNGCTGVTDGENDECKIASCFHDALYQFKVGKRFWADELFTKLLLRINWKYTLVYYIGVRILGIFYWYFKN